MRRPFLLTFIAATCICAAAHASVRHLATNASVALDDGGRDYHVTVKVSETDPMTGATTQLPSLGVSQKFGLPAKTEHTVSNGTVHVKLETTSAPGTKEVRCLVTVGVEHNADYTSEFVLTAPAE